jgi:cell division septal protein FtsQ
MRVRWRVVGTAGAVIAIGAIALGAPRIGRQLAFFRLRQVEVTGARYLDEADVVRRLGLRRDASTLDRLDAVRKAAAGIPGVLAAVVERRLPGTLRVSLREATPVALVALVDRLALVDSTGHVLPFDPVRAPTSLPISGHDSMTPALLRRVMRSDPTLYASIESARLDRSDVVLDIGARRIRLRPEADDAVLRAVAAVLSYLQRHAVPWREIDARYHSRIFVQKGAA